MENVRNRTKTVLVTLIALNTRNLSEIVIGYNLRTNVTYVHWIFAHKTRFVILNFFKILLFLLKRKFLLYFVPLMCRFLNSEKSIGFSSLTGDIFVKTQNFDSYNIIMT